MRLPVPNLQKIWSLRPAVSDAQGSETAYWLHIFALTLTIVIIIVGSLPFILYSGSVDPRLLTVNLFALSISIGAIALVYVGHVKIAAYLVVGLLFVIVTYAIAGVFDGIRNPNLLAYFVLIPLTGLLLGTRAMFRFAILCLLTIGVIFYLEQAAILIPNPKPRATWDYLISWVCALSLNTALLMAMLRRSGESAKRVQQAMKEIQATNQALQESQAQLQQALDKAQELNELKSRFVSMASHEFRTPVATILILTETLSYYLPKLTPEQIEQRLTKIRMQGEYLKGIMEDMLNLSQLQKRQMPFKPVPVDLDHLCRTIIEELKSNSATTHRLIYTSNDPLPCVMLDPRLMRQILDNLLSNALKYSPDDKAVVVNLSHTHTDVILQVQDEGIGIPQADLQHLFQPFHRAVNVGTIPGTGLGLVIAREAVELHGGVITVESEVDRGTVFTVQLPIPLKDGRTNEQNSSD